MERACGPREILRTAGELSVSADEEERRADERVERDELEPLEPVADAVGREVVRDHDGEEHARELEEGELERQLVAGERSDEDERRHDEEQDLDRRARADLDR